MKYSVLFIFAPLTAAFYVARTPSFVSKKLEAVAGFSGFGHAIRTEDKVTPSDFSGFGQATKVPGDPNPPSFSGFGQAFAGQSAKSDASPSVEPAAESTTIVKSPLEEAKEFLMQATEKATKLREVMKLKENQNESKIQQLMTELKNQEEACKSYEAQISSISSDFEQYKNNVKEEQTLLQEQVATKEIEINAALAQAKEICDLLDDLIQV